MQDGEQRVGRQLECNPHGSLVDSSTDDRGARFLDSSGVVVTTVLLVDELV